MQSDERISSFSNIIKQICDNEPPRIYHATALILFTITLYVRSYQFPSLCHAACLALVIVRSFVRSFDRSSSLCVLYASEQCDCDAVSRSLFSSVPMINANGADKYNVRCSCIYLRSICRPLSFPSWQLCPIPWLVTMRAMLHGYAMVNCCNIHGKSLPAILMAVYFGSGLCLMPICNGKNGNSISSYKWTIQFVLLCKQSVWFTGHTDKKMIRHEKTIIDWPEVIREWILCMYLFMKVLNWSESKISTLHISIL